MILIIKKQFASLCGGFFPPFGRFFQSRIFLGAASAFSEAVRVKEGPSVKIGGFWSIKILIAEIKIVVLEGGFNRWCSLLPSKLKV